VLQTMVQVVISAANVLELPAGKNF